MPIYATPFCNPNNDTYALADATVISQTTDVLLQIMHSINFVRYLYIHIATHYHHSWQNMDIKNIVTRERKKNMIGRCYMKSKIIHFHAAGLLLRQLDMPLWVVDAIDLFNLASTLTMQKHSIIRNINTLCSMKRFVMQRNYNQSPHIWPVFLLTWYRKSYSYAKSIQ